MQLAERMTRIGIESAFEVLQSARALEAQGKNIVHLEIGQPDFPTPAHVNEAAKQALDEGWTDYGPTPVSRTSARRSPPTSRARAASPSPGRTCSSCRAASRSCSSR